MRRHEREMKNKETIDAILRQNPVGRIATINEKGIPIIKPVNFLYSDGKIYLHSSIKGEKIKDIQRGSPVCFEVDEPIAYVVGSQTPCKASYYYRSIIIKGKSALVRDSGKKVEILKKMMRKYQPEGVDGGISLEILTKTEVIEIWIEEITGKENLG